MATGIALENGLVITTSLVTRHPFEKIFVETIKGETIAARIVGQDDRSGLTLLRLDKKGLQPLPQAGPAEVGNWVALVGLFYDRFPAIFQGIVSSLSENELILNAPVAPGAAGGAVVNKKGELLGIIRGSVGFSFTPDLTFKDHSASIVVSGSKSDSGGLCYAIPVEQVRRIADKLKAGARSIPGWLGVSFNSDTNQVQETYKESPAAKAGITGGDRIEELAGKPITSFRDIAAALRVPLCRRKGQRHGHPGGQTAAPGRGAGRTPPQGTAGAPGAALASGPGRGPRERHALPGRTAGRKCPKCSNWSRPCPGCATMSSNFGGARQLGVDVMEITPELGRKFGVKEGYGLLGLARQRGIGRRQSRPAGRRRHRPGQGQRHSQHVRPATRPQRR